jgi:hypothetical protein
VIGDVVISVSDLRGRCIKTPFDLDTLAHDPDALTEIRRRLFAKDPRDRYGSASELARELVPAPAQCGVPRRGRRVSRTRPRRMDPPS